MKFLVILGIFLIISFFRWLARQGEQQTANRELSNELDRRLRIGVTPDQFVTEDGNSLPVWKVTASGTVAVPHTDYPVRFHVRVADMTDTTDGAMPVYCHIPDCTDDEGLFLIDIESQIPHEVSSMEGFEVAAIPTFALVAPHRGKRRFKVFVDVVDQRDLERVFQAGSATHAFEQAAHGYMEYEQRTEEQEMLIGRLAVAFCASDGQIDKTETAVIKRYFSERLASRDADGAHKKNLSALLQETRNSLKSGRVQAKELIDRICKSILEHDAADFNQAAYELCVQVVAADEVVDAAEQAHLAELARQLDIPAEFAKEIHDRNFRISMYGQQADESLLDMPPGLDHDEKIAFLNREYNKWRARATHEDEAVQTEATRRLQLITKLRRELTDG